MVHSGASPATPTHDPESRPASAPFDAAVLLDATGGALLAETLDGVVVHWSDAAERLYGHAAAEVLGRPGSLLVPPDRRPEWEEAVARVGRGESVRGLDTARLHKAGTRLDVSLSLAPLRDVHGRVVAVAIAAWGRNGPARAGTPARVAGDPAEELERLKALDAFKTQLINMAAHELGTPLTPIKLQLHVLRASILPRLTEDERKSMEILERNVERLSQLVQDVLEVARLQANRLRVERSLRDLQEVVQEAIDSYREPANQAGITLRADPGPPLWVLADGKRLIQVLFNLLGNAIKFTPTGGQIVVKAGLDGADAVVRVRDTGAGIRPGDVEKLFQPFTQLHDPVQRGRPGSGLGLYICRGIVELHGGRIWAESPGTGLGSTFAFALPAAKAPTGAEAAALAEKAAEVRREETFSRRVRELI